jgi:uncharacterized membrane protein YidH (DUF202 family)
LLGSALQEKGQPAGCDGGCDGRSNSRGGAGADIECGGSGFSPLFAGKRVVDRQWRLEPKVVMANERTFLSWQRSFLPLGIIGLGLWKYGHPEGLVLSVFSVMGVWYGARRFYVRHRLIVSKVVTDEIHDPHCVVTMATFFTVSMALGLWYHHKKGS